MIEHRAITNKERLREANKVTWWGLIINILLTGFKFFAGFIGKSQALIADAVHSLSDLLGDIVVFIGLNMGAKPSDKNHRYGHGKIETLSSAIIGVILLIVGVRICWNGIEEIISFSKGNYTEAPTSIALIAAILSIFSKEILYQYTIRTAKKLKSEILVVNAWHHRSDGLSSIAVLIGIAGAMFFGPSWRILDPAAAMAVSILIGKVAADMIWKACAELIERALPPEMEEKILQIASDINKLSTPHHLKTRRIGSNIAIEMDICVVPEMTVQEAHHLAGEVEKALRTAFGENTLITIHIEPEGGSDE